ncbi:hypothetical protein BN2127_JRS10_03014 [Bacillus subtilis]|nr:hypothetical protein BN2127_JRS10_03014 [Bacillus subtilis]
MPPFQSFNIPGLPLEISNHNVFLSLSPVVGGFLASIISTV